MALAAICCAVLVAVVPRLTATCRKRGATVCWQVKAGRDCDSGSRAQLGLVPADAAEKLLVTGRSLAADEEMTMFTKNLEEKVVHLERALAEEQEGRQQREAAINGWVDQVQSELIGAGKRAESIQQQISKVLSCLRQDER